MASYDFNANFKQIRDAKVRKTSMLHNHIEADKLKAL